MPDQARCLALGHGSGQQDGRLGQVGHWGRIALGEQGQVGLQSRQAGDCGGQVAVDVATPVNPDHVDTSMEQPNGEMAAIRSEEHTSELQSLMRISYAVFCLKKKTTLYTKTQDNITELLNTIKHLHKLNTTR